jgi:hypothetical protein
MSRKDYTAIAEILSRWIVPTGLIGELAEFLAADNPRFDRERFVRACLANEKDELAVESAVVCWGRERN